ncbi:hypothetical protein LOC67_17245 [Stieleria sp. JC731]|uniref:hypothetical protein n=1 Tax=Pirellulaceae TaxID=2691357 RepID=UPI001E2F867D|nr:hypothetical protein [Stieleria sp. JC731]MCC9602303.1 hypothetical protein [Stieleria sp. JC731]
MFDVVRHAGRLDVGIEPNTYFAVECSCGHEALVATFQAGTSVSCEQCGAELRVPSLRELKSLPVVDVSPIGELEAQIAEQEEVFDGRCQLCDVHRGAYWLPVLVVAFRDNDGYCRSFVVPCIVCDLCFGDFRRGVWSGRIQGLWNAGVKLVLLVVAVLLAIVIAFILPVIGILGVLLFGASLILYLSRFDMNPFIRRHLNRICRLDETLSSADGYRTRLGRWHDIEYED